MVCKSVASGLDTLPRSITPDLRIGYIVFDHRSAQARRLWVFRVLQYQLVSEERRNSRRTIADGLEALRQAANFDGHAEIRVRRFPLRSGHIVGLVGLFYEISVEDRGWVVFLPTASLFYARRENSDRQQFDIFRLDHATVDQEGTVILTDGTRLRTVEIVPSDLFGEPTELDWRIVHLTIKIIGAQDRCYRSLRDDAPLALKDMIPDIRRLDCSMLYGLELPLLKEIAYQIKKHDPTLANVPGQTIANTLRKFGMRIPRSRPRFR